MEKTEQPTPRRLRKAREQGDSPVSIALLQAATFVVALALAPALLAATAARSAELVRAAIERGQSTISAPAAAWLVVSLVLPMLGAAALAAAVLGFAQTGGSVAFSKLAPDLSRANPFAGLGNIVSGVRVLAVLRALLAAGVVGWLAVRLTVDHAGDLANTAGSTRSAGAVAGALATRLAWIAALVGVALAGLDVVVTRWAWLARHRMSRYEVKREKRETEADPELAARRQRAYRELFGAAMLDALADATVVIGEPNRLATALRYSEAEREAGRPPRVVAQGQGELATKIADTARAHDVPFVRDWRLARALAELEVGDEIPEASYDDVAETISQAAVAATTSRPA